MNTPPDLSTLRDQLSEILWAHAEASGGALAEDLRTRFLELAQDMVFYWADAARGSEEHKVSINHLRVQAELLGALIYNREQKRMTETFQAVVLRLAQFAGIALKGLL